MVKVYYCEEICSLHLTHPSSRWGKVKGAVGTHLQMWSQNHGQNHRTGGLTLCMILVDGENRSTQTQRENHANSTQKGLHHYYIMHRIENKGILTTSLKCFQL